MDKKFYLTVLDIVSEPGCLFLQLTSDGAIHSHDSLDSAYKPFEGFEDKVNSSDVTWHRSAVMGIMTIHPYIICLEGDAAQLKEYVIDDTVRTLQGGYVVMPGLYVKVSEDILKFKVMDICKSVMASAGIGLPEGEKNSFGK